MAVYTLLDIKKEIPPVFKDQHDVGVLFNALKTMHRLPSAITRMGFVIKHTEPEDCPRDEFALRVYKVPTVVGWKPANVLM